jgi:hypothetical protein
MPTQILPSSQSLQTSCSEKVIEMRVRKPYIQYNKRLWGRVEPIAAKEKVQLERNMKILQESMSNGRGVRDDAISLQ